MGTVETPIQAYLEVLVAVARADGIVNEHEAQAIRSAMQGLDVSEQLTGHVESLLDMGNLYDEAARLGSVAVALDVGTLAETLRDAYVIAGIDGEMSMVELNVIDRLLDVLNVDEDSKPTLHEWARSAAEHQMMGYALIQEALSVDSGL